jgi:hypothetical protein
LLVVEENGKWWEALEASLKATRCHSTFSLIAPIMLAILAWVLTIVASFDALLGSPATALNIAGGSLWSWLVCSSLRPACHANPMQDYC